MTSLIKLMTQQMAEVLKKDFDITHKEAKPDSSRSKDNLRSKDSPREKDGQDQNKYLRQPEDKMDKKKRR